MPTVAPDLVEILVCPETKQPVRLMNGTELGRLNERIRGGQLRNRGGAEVKQELLEALVREDGRIAYPVDDGIPVMLIDESIEL
jgi:uncharacterized protein YbaR (Trm112 family)